MSSIQQRRLSPAATSASSASATSHPGSLASDYSPFARHTGSFGTLFFTVFVFIIFTFPIFTLASPWTSDQTDGWLHVFDTSEKSILLAPTVYTTPNPTSHTLPRFGQPANHHLVNPYSLLSPIQSIEPETTASRITRLGHFGKIVRNPTIVKKHAWALEYMHELVDGVLASIRQDALEAVRTGPLLIDPPKYLTANVGVAIIYDMAVSRKENGGAPEVGHWACAHQALLPLLLDCWMVPFAALVLVFMPKLFACVGPVAFKAVGKLGMCIPAVNAIHEDKLAQVAAEHEEELKALKAAHRLEVDKLTSTIYNKDKQLEGAMLETIDQAAVAAHQLATVRSDFAGRRAEQAAQIAIQATHIKQLQLELVREEDKLRCMSQFLDGTRHELTETRRALRTSESRMGAMSREHHRVVARERECLMDAVADAYKERDVAKLAEHAAARSLDELIKAQRLAAKEAVQVADAAVGTSMDESHPCFLSFEVELSAAQVRLELRPSRARTPAAQRLPTKTSSSSNGIISKVMSLPRSMLW